MQALDSYPLPPGCCAFCSGNASPLIDVGLNTDDLPVEMAVEQSGWVYVCVQCVFHMAHLLGGASPEYAERLKGELAEVTAQRDALVSRLAAAQLTIDRLTAPEVLHAAH
jgi:hypothetical protein